MEDGIYVLVKTYEKMVRQNLKNLILTAPGERVMLPNFGVGIRNYLFNLKNTSTEAAIRTRIISQVKTYMPFVAIDQVIFGFIPGEVATSNIDSREVGNSLRMRIFYTITPISTSDSLDINESLISS
jgi:hypothetical protein